MIIFFYLSVKTSVLGAYKNRLVETVLLSTHNMFWLRNKKNNFLLHTFILGPGEINMVIILYIIEQ